MTKARRTSLILLLVAAFSATSCATTVGTLAGPVTGPVTFWRHTHGVPDWVKVLLSPMAIGAGPFVGMAAGARADVGWVTHGEYGVLPSPPFEVVFDPANTALDRPPQR